MSKKTILGLGVSILFTLTACGRAGSPASSAADETCAGNACTEQSINAPVGPQTTQEAIPYDNLLANPSRASLRFPAYQSSWGMKKAIYDKAVAYFESHKSTILNPRYFIIVDFNLNASQKRMFLFDLSNDTVERHNVAAGKNSDADNDGYATKFSNASGSLMSSLGFYQTLATYNGEHGYSLRLKGLSSTNSNVYARSIVIHPADYVSEAAAHAGRSWGCPAVDPKISTGLINKVRNGAIMLIDR